MAASGSWLIEAEWFVRGVIAGPRDEPTEEPTSLYVTQHSSLSWLGRPQGEAREPYCKRRLDQTVNEMRV